LAAWTALCVLATHQIAYFLSYGDAHARAHALEASGHSWYALLLPALLLGAVLAVVSTWFESRKRTAARSLPLYATSVAGFLLLEFVERFQHLGSLDAVLHNLLHGAGYVPVLLGVVLLLVIVPIARYTRAVIERIARGDAPSPARTAHVWQRPPVCRWTARAHHATAPRGPPVPAQSVSYYCMVSYR
jgi:hypothetical protein